jgi:hypothetical protein
MIKISNIQNLFVKTLELSFSFLEISDFKTVTSKKRFIFPKALINSPSDAVLLINLEN